MTSIQDARIISLYSVKAKKANRKDVYADTTKISPMYKALIKSDFIVTFYVPNIDGLTHFQLKVLMYHELLHVGYDDGLCYVIPHDVEDFEDIIKEYGIHWADKKGGE